MAKQLTLDSLIADKHPQVVNALNNLESYLIESIAGNDSVAYFARETINAGGKRLRPLLLLLIGAGGDETNLLNAAAAVELIHNATLVHDDVIDHAQLRRGMPTVVAKSDRKTAAAVGDYLFACAFTLLALTKSRAAVTILAQACSKLAQGELMQRLDTGNINVSIERYLLRCQLKTAALFEAACRLGAVLSQAKEVESYAQYGSQIGLAFQILDDVLDLDGFTKNTGKRRGTDLLDGTVTFPLIIAVNREKKLANIDLNQLTDFDEVERLCNLIEATGALEESCKFAFTLINDAKTALGNISCEQRETLEIIADLVVTRSG